MVESLLTLILIGFSAGFIFSMPIAGPVSIIITSNALKGNLKFCIRTAMGASLVEFLYVLIAVLGLSSLVSLYSPLIPYLLVVGSIFLFFVGIKISRTSLRLEDIESASVGQDKTLEKKGGLRTGIIINLTNPSFFFGILASSFLVLTFASSIGLNTGGLDLLIKENVSSFQEMTSEDMLDIDTTFVQENKLKEPPPEQSSYTFGLSIAYAASLAMGGFLWLVLLSKILVKYRRKIKIVILNWAIRIMGIVLVGIAIYLFIKAILIFSSL